MSISGQLTSIDPSKGCLEFLEKRISSDKYRGIQVSQHNRYDSHILLVLLEKMYELVGEGLMTIRTTDLSKRAYNTDEEKTYATYVNNVVKELGRGTQDSIRKNLFVDLHRMGLIDRYNKDAESLDPYSRSSVKYVSITELGKSFIDNENNPFERNLIYTKAIDTLTNGLADELLDIVSINGSLTIDEFQFFISFINQKLDDTIYTKSTLVDYLISYRSLSRAQKECVRTRIENYCKPENFGGDKTNKRDYHNWKNEEQQIFMLMDQTVLYELNKRKDKLVIRLGEDGLFENDMVLKRSEKQKEYYFEQHGVSKKTGFELHHIIPLLTATNKTEFSTLDVWENMAYIDGYTHAKISQTKNRNKRLEFNGDDMVLIDPTGTNNNITSKKDDNVLYDTKNKEKMIEFNSSILDNH